MQNILVIRFGSLGDVILTSATILNLKINFPDSRIIYFTKERFRSLVSRFDGVDEVIVLPEGTDMFRYISLLQDLDKRNFDQVIDLHGNARSWFARRFLSAERKLIYPKRWMERQRMVRRRNKVIPKTYPHTIDLYNTCVEQLGGKAYGRRPVIQFEHGDEDLEISRDDTTPSVVIAPGAAHPNKQWEMEKFADVARQLHAKCGCRVLWTVATDADLVVGLKDTFPQGTFVELVGYPIDRLGGIIAEARLTIANDTGLGHLSSSVGTPVIALFGPTHPALGFAPRGQFDQVIEVDEFCRPCSLHGKVPCYRDQRYCFTRISAGEVAESAIRLIESDVNRHKALFADRDGTIIKEKHYLSDPNQIEFVPGAPEALRRIAAEGYKLVILSNQSGVARGLLTIDDVERMNGRLLEMLSAEGVDIEGVYYCPYYKDGSVPEFSIDSDLRKPFPGMPEIAAEELGIDLRRSVVIGDKLDDLNLGRIIGADSYMVRTGHGEKEEGQLASEPQVEKKVLDSIADIVKHVVR